MKQSNILTKLEQDLIQKLERSTSLTVSLSNEVKSLNKELVSARKQLVTANAELEVTKKQLPPQPQPLPAGFKASSATSQALTTSKSQLKTAQKLLQEEVDYFTAQKLQDIATRNSKSLADYNYKAALNGPYAGAVKAISAKRKEVANNGVEVFSGISGYSFKALHDPANHTLFTFELISDPDLEISGQSYRINKSEVSPIGAGNVYFLTLVRPA